MSEGGTKDLFTRLADRGEQAIERMGDLPVAGRVMEALNTMRERVDDLQRRVRGLDQLQTRVEDLERRVDDLTRTSGSSSGAPSASPIAGATAQTTAEPAEGAPMPPEPPSSTPGGQPPVD